MGRRGDDSRRPAGYFSSQKLAGVSPARDRRSGEEHSRDCDAPATVQDAFGLCGRRLALFPTGCTPIPSEVMGPCRRALSACGYSSRGLSDCRRLFPGRSACCDATCTRARDSKDRRCHHHGDAVCGGHRRRGPGIRARRNRGGLAVPRAGSSATGRCNHGRPRCHGSFGLPTVGLLPSYGGRTWSFPVGRARHGETLQWDLGAVGVT
ncbi:MAG: hypothetical protein QOD46_638 [Actinomycetota bacterium]|nr:hypothetical protein [Actinomycetota bacterium]